MKEKWHEYWSDRNYDSPEIIAKWIENVSTFKWKPKSKWVTDVFEVTIIWVDGSITKIPFEDKQLIDNVRPFYEKSQKNNN